MFDEKTCKISQNISLMFLLSLTHFDWPQKGASDQVSWFPKTCKDFHYFKYCKSKASKDLLKSSSYSSESLLFLPQNKINQGQGQLCSIYHSHIWQFTESHLALAKIIITIYCKSNAPKDMQSWSLTTLTGWFYGG